MSSIIRCTIVRFQREMMQSTICLNFREMMYQFLTIALGNPTLVREWLSGHAVRFCMKWRLSLKRLIQVPVSGLIQVLVSGLIQVLLSGLIQVPVSGSYGYAIGCKTLLTSLIMDMNNLRSVRSGRSPIYLIANKRKT